jgi:hypothetical protein
MVLEADRDWSRESLFPTTYEFSGGRKFAEYQAPGERYEFLDEFLSRPWEEINTPWENLERAWEEYA